MQDTKTITIKGRQPCPACLKTIKPAERNIAYVACAQCGTVYHSACCDDQQPCQHHAPNEMSSCGSTDYHAVRVEGQVPTLPIITVQPLVFKGLAPSPLPAGSTPAPAPSPSAPSPTQPPVPAIIPGGTSRASAPAYNPQAVVTPLQRLPVRLLFVGIGTSLTWLIAYANTVGPFLMPTRNLPTYPSVTQDFLTDLARFPVHALFFLGVMCALLPTLIYFILQRTTDRRPDWLNAPICAVLFGGYIAAMHRYNPFNALFYAEANDLQLLVSSILTFGLAFVLPVLIFRRRGLGRAVSAGILMAGAYPLNILLTAAFTSSGRFVFPPINDVILIMSGVFGMGLGVLPWLPEVLFYRGKALDILSAPAASATPVTTHIGDTFAGLWGRTVVMAGVITFANGILLGTSISLMSIALNLAYTYVVNRWMVRPILNNPPLSYWEDIIPRMWRTIWLGALIGAGIGALWSIFSARAYVLALSETIFSTLVIGLLAVTSASSGHTRRGRLLKGILWTPFTGIIIIGVYAFYIYILDSRNYSIVSPNISPDIAAGVIILVTISNFIIMLPVWFADFLARPGRS